jgi:hypothetical protein
MAAVSTIVGVVGLGIAAVSAVEQHDAQKEAAEAGRRQADAMQEQAGHQRNQLELNRKQADLQAARQVRSAVRQARIARASVINTGANANTSGSSGVLGGASSISSQNASNMSFFSSMGSLNNQVIDSQVAQGHAAARAGAAQGDAYVAQAEAAQWGALGNLGGTIFSSAGGFRTIFGGNKNGQT